MDSTERLPRKRVKSGNSAVVVGRSSELAVHPDSGIPAIEMVLPSSNRQQYFPSSPQRWDGKAYTPARRGSSPVPYESWDETSPNRGLAAEVR